MSELFSVHLPWLENKIADLWPFANTADIARRLVVPEARVANALARMRDRGDARLRKFVSR
jgi:hypothetical protein